MVTAAPALFAFMESASSSGGLSVSRWACVPPRYGSGYAQTSQRKPIIQTHPLSEKGSDYIGLVREAGVEPARPCEHWHLKPASLPIPPLARLLAVLLFSTGVMIPHERAVVNSFFDEIQNS